MFALFIVLRFNAYSLGFALPFCFSSSSLATGHNRTWILIFFFCCLLFCFLNNLCGWFLLVAAATATLRVLVSRGPQFFFCYWILTRVCVCVFVELYIYFLLIIIIYSSTSDSLLVFFPYFRTACVWISFFFTLFARHFKNEFNGKERLLSVSRIIFTFFSLFQFFTRTSNKKKIDN